MLRRTPLHATHVAAGARMVEFGGYEMPLQYSSIRDEHLAVRRRAGIFDLSHMGEVRLTGAGAEATVQALVANDVSRLAPGGALYGVMCNDAGGIVDDVVVYRVEDGFWIVVNAGRRDADLAWMGRHTLDGCRLDDESDATALLAIQGPAALDLVQTLTSVRLSELHGFQSLIGDVGGTPARISRTGYTGEDGVELYCSAELAEPLWTTLIAAGREHGLRPAGLGARDTLRLEAGLRLYGQDMDEGIDPFSCGLGWTVKLGKGDFIGAGALRGLDARNPPRRFIGLALAPRHIPRHGMRVLAQGEAVGEVTSGSFSFSLGHGIATAYVPADLDHNADLAVDIRGQPAPARRVSLPFYKRDK